MENAGPPIGQPATKTPAVSTPATCWGYEPHNGPEFWGSHDEAFSACAQGAEQLPIDLTNGRSVDLVPVVFDYRPSHIDIEKKGHTIQMNPESGNDIVLDGIRHELSQFHFHCASEHLAEGTRCYPMKLHLVHCNAVGGIAVVGFLAAESDANAALGPAWAHLPPEPGTFRSIRGEIDLAALLPPFRMTWRYRGSRTTTPRTEGVAWIVPDEPLSMLPAQAETFAALYPHKCRPVQTLSERVPYPRMMSVTRTTGRMRTACL